MALLAGQWTCDSQVTGSSPGWKPLRSGLGQATYICVPVIKQYNLVLAKGEDLFGLESNCGPGGK